jgi:hypothetical protein
MPLLRLHQLGGMLGNAASCLEPRTESGMRRLFTRVPSQYYLRPGFTPPRFYCRLSLRERTHGKRSFCGANGNNAHTPRARRVFLLSFVPRKDAWKMCVRSSRRVELASRAPSHWADAVAGRPTVLHGRRCRAGKGHGSGDAHVARFFRFFFDKDNTCPCGLLTCIAIELRSGECLTSKSGRWATARAPVIVGARMGMARQRFPCLIGDV